MKNKIIKIIFSFNIFLIAIVNYTYAISPKENLNYKGIDVSDWQGYIDYSQVKESGIEIVYIKASQGNNIKDPYFEINYQNAKQNNLKIGFYHYLTATNEEEANQEAIFFSAVISGKQPDCKLALDYEQFENLGIEQINKIALAFIQKVKELTKKQVIIYSNLSNSINTFNNQIANTSELWLAYYGNSEDLINIQTRWDTYIGIQYTDQAKIQGITGNVDQDQFTSEIFLENTTQIEEIKLSTINYNTETIEYTVKRGDTLWQIANKYKTTIEEIVKINGIQNPNLIYPGQLLKIITNTSEQGKTSNSTQKTYYTIAKGDTLWQIANKYGITINQLIEWNNIQNPNLIYPGQKLIINKTYKSINNYTYYTVKRGDTLWNIAKMYKTCAIKIARLNGIRNPNLIYPGQIIKIKNN